MSTSSPKSTRVSVHCKRNRRGIVPVPCRQRCQTLTVCLCLAEAHERDRFEVQSWISSGSSKQTKEMLSLSHSYMMLKHHAKCLLHSIASSLCLTKLDPPEFKARKAVDRRSQGDVSCLCFNRSRRNFTAVDLERAQKNRYEISASAVDGWTRFTSPWGPKLLLSQTGESGEVLIWMFRVEGNSSWSVGVVPEHDVQNSDYLEDKEENVTVLENGETVVDENGDVTSKPMHNKWVRFTYDIKARKATFHIGITDQETIVKQVHFDGPARIALSTFCGTEVTILTSPDAAISDVRLVTPSQLVGECGPLVAECLYEKYWGGNYEANVLEKWREEFDEKKRPKLLRRLEKFRRDGKLPAEKVHDKEAFEEFCDEKCSTAKHRYLCRRGGSETLLKEFENEMNIDPAYGVLMSVSPIGSGSCCLSHARPRM